MFEALAIRFLWLLYALSPKKKPGLCPPVCSEGHSYKWPCRARSYRKENPDFGLGLSGWSFGFDIKNMKTDDWPVDESDLKEDFAMKSALTYGEFMQRVYRPRQGLQSKFTVIDESIDDKK